MQSVSHALTTTAPNQPLPSFTSAGVVSCWFILGAVLNPTQYLPYGMAVVTLGVVMAATWSAMWKAAMVQYTPYAYPPEPVVCCR